MRGLAVLVAIGACFTPKPPTGAPCETDAHCPAPFVCSVRMTCESERGIPGSPDAAIPVDIAATGCDPCEPNDTAGGAVDVTDGGTFTANALDATDDVVPDECGGDGGRDLFYRITLQTPQVYYFDTLDSSYDTVLRVFDKPCAEVGAGSGVAVCENDACGGTRSQVALALPAGESCLVVDQATAGESGALSLRVIPGGRDGSPLPAGEQALSGNTCDSTNITEPSNQDCDGPGSEGKDHAYFFTTCPGESKLLDAGICPEPAWDPVLYVKRIDGNQIGCNDDSCGFGPSISDVAIAGSTLYFLYVDGFDGTHCGDYTVTTNLR